MSTVGRPLVSIVMPCLNGARFIQEAIDSVLQQTFGDWELLVIDDGSSDGSVELIRRFERAHPQVQLLAGNRSGTAAARNRGIHAARGRYVAFLDADDLWLPHKLMEQVATMQGRELGFCWCDYDVMNASGATIRTQACAASASYEDVLRKRAIIGCLTAMYDTAAFGKQYMPNIRMRQDFALWLRLLRIAERDGQSCGGIEKSLARYRVHSGGMTRNKLSAAYYQWRLYRDFEELPLLRCCSCMGDYFVNALRDRTQGRKSLQVAD